MKYRAGISRTAAALLTLLIAASAVADPGMQSFTADYAVTHGRMRIGEAEFSLTGDDNGHYIYASRTVPRGLAKLVHRGTVVERTEFSIDDDHLIAHGFTSDDGTDKGKRDASVSFDWDSSVALATHEGETEELAIEAGTIDRMLVQVALMRDLATGNEVGPYTLVDKLSLTRYDFSVLGSEEIEVPAGAYTATKLKRQRPGSSRETFIWCAPELGFLPVKLQQFRKGRLQIGMELTGVGF